MSQLSDRSEVQSDGADFHLSDEILAVIPTDPYEQLDLARKITSLAIASRVSLLESEVTRNRIKLKEKEGTIEALEERVSQAQRALQESQSRLKLALEENDKLLKERDTNAWTIKKLSRDLLKLESFKKQLMRSLSEDSTPGAEAVEVGTHGQLTAKSYNGQDDLRTYASYKALKDANGVEFFPEDAKRNSNQRFSITPSLSPTETPKLASLRGSPRRYSTATSPEKVSGKATPTKSHFDAQHALSWYSSSQQSSAANSPPRGRPGRTRIDGKDFFRQARSRLSYEQFSAFLSSIKELNAHKQTREETLRNAEGIFGVENKDLYQSFHALLHRNIC